MNRERFESPPSYYETSGFPDEWKGNDGMTRSDTRFMIFWLNKGQSGANARNCFPTVEEAIAQGESRPEWKPQYILDRVNDNALAHEFDG